MSAERDAIQRADLAILATRLFSLEALRFLAGEPATEFAFVAETHFGNRIRARKVIEKLERRSLRIVHFETKGA